MIESIFLSNERMKMKELEKKIIKDGKVLPGDILKIDNFLNHQIDVAFLNKIAQEFKSLFNDQKIDKILTIEASGIAIAVLVAQHFDMCPVVFAKKNKAKNMSNEVYSAIETSYTRGHECVISVSKII
jgi:Adenine/guanine phosphoribosyltransferases and related PRPP-binding proteins